MAGTDRKRADARLSAALDGADQEDPRPYYRPVLRYLKDRDEAAYERGLRHYEDVLIPAVAAEADPLEAWAEYGRRLADELGSGRLLELDSTGRARSIERLLDARGLVLFVPDTEAAPALVLRCPREATRAQRAAIELLVEGRQSASAYQ